MDEAILERVKDVIVEHHSLSRDEITPDVTFEELGMDSLAIVEMVMAFEEEFGIEIPDEDGEKIKTVGQAVEYIQAKKAG